MHAIILQRVTLNSCIATEKYSKEQKVNKGMKIQRDALARLSMTTVS